MTHIFYNDIAEHSICMRARRNLADALDDNGEVCVTCSVLAQTLLTVSSPKKKSPKPN